MHYQYTGHNTQTCSTLAAMLFVPLTGSAAFLDSEIINSSPPKRDGPKWTDNFRSVNRFLEDNKNELQIKRREKPEFEPLYFLVLKQMEKWFSCH